MTINRYFSLSFKWNYWT